MARRPINYEWMCDLPGHSECVASLKVSPNGEILASGSFDGTLKLWTFVTGVLVHNINAHSRGINDIAWSGNCEQLISVSDDMTLKLWDPINGKCVHVFTFYKQIITTCCFDWSSKYVAIGLYSGAINIIDIRSRKVVKHFQHSNRCITSVDFNLNYSALMCGSLDGITRLWDINNNNYTIVNIALDQNYFVNSAIFINNGDFFIESKSNGTHKLWDIHMRCKRIYKGHLSEKHCINACIAGQSIVSGSENNLVYIWDADTTAINQILFGHDGVVLCTAAHPFYEVIASSSLGKDKAIKMWRNTI